MVLAAAGFFDELLQLQECVDGSLHPQFAEADLLEVRVQFVLDMLQQHYDLLVEGGALFYQNAAKSKAELIQTYQEKHELVLQYQL